MAAAGELNATCELLRQLAVSMFQLEDAERPADSDSKRVEVSESAKYLLREVVNPALCVVGIVGIDIGIGIVGNSMNAVVMTRRRVRSALDGRMERASRLGLLMLTIADILCCVASLVVTVGAAERTLFRSGDDAARMLIVAYGPYVQNLLAKSSTWLVVVTSVDDPPLTCN